MQHRFDRTLIGIVHCLSLNQNKDQAMPQFLVLLHERVDLLLLFGWESMGQIRPREELLHPTGQHLILYPTEIFYGFPQIITLFATGSIYKESQPPVRSISSSSSSPVLYAHSSVCPTDHHLGRVSTAQFCVHTLKSGFLRLSLSTRLLSKN